jgi:hypothetical protein
MIGGEGPVAGRKGMSWKSSHVRVWRSAVGVLAAAVVLAAAWSVRAMAGAPGQALYPAETARAEQAMNELQTALLAKLRSAMEAGGPAAAVEVCRTEARTIAEAVALKQGIELGRTSHLVRNTANAPRPWARAIVEGGAGAKAAAEQIRVVDLGERVGVLRPIGTADMCTRCHGAPSDVKRNLGEALTAAYPQDRAVGFAAGDLRGWFWAEVPKSAK